MSRYRLACDIGGTFTDFALLDESTGTLHTAKVLSTRDDPSRAVLHGLGMLADKHPAARLETRNLLHATTLAINAVLERRGASTAVLATNGFRDVLEMRRSRRADVADIFGDPPEPLVSRQLRLEVDERVWSDGRVLRPLNQEQASEQIQYLCENGIQSVAVCLMHAYANPAHEHALRALIRDTHPTMYVSLSSDVLPEEGEYERTSCTVINAYVQPVIDQYLSRLESGMSSAGFTCPLLLMLSGGGLASPSTVRTFPARLIESGAAAGVIAAHYFGDLLDLRSVLAFDMGGTTAKISVVQDGQVPITSDLEVARAYRFKKGTGLPVNVPSVELLEIGAGGGSIASINETGSLQVGPQSAGADPGPICYGLGGTEPTVTDADLVLGYLDADYFLGGDMKLAPEAARDGITNKIALPLGITLEEAAWGIHEIVCENMAGAASAHIAERGDDPTRTALVAFGGAGPVHAYSIAKKIGVPTIILPPSPGVMSAVGLLTAPAAYDVARSYRTRLSEIDRDTLASVFEDMEVEALSMLRSTGAPGNPTLRHIIEMCYLGQGLALPVPVTGIPEREQLADLFTNAYEARFGYAYEGAAIGLVRLRVRTEISGAGLNLNDSAPAVLSTSTRTRNVFCPVRRRWSDFPVYPRNLLAAGQEFQGPAIIEEIDSTLVVGPDATVTVGPYHMLKITIGGESC